MRESVGWLVALVPGTISSDVQGKRDWAHEPGVRGYGYGLDWGGGRQRMQDPGDRPVEDLPAIRVIWGVASGADSVRLQV